MDGQAAVERLSVTPTHENQNNEAAENGNADAFALQQAAEQQILLQQLAANSEIANQFGLLQSGIFMPGTPLNFSQQNLVVSQAPHLVPQSPHQHNSLASGESPHPHTPSSHSMGSPPPQIDQPGTPRADTPGTSLTHQMMLDAQIQHSNKMQALQQAQQQQVLIAIIFLI